MIVLGWLTSLTASVAATGDHARQRRRHFAHIAT